MVGNASIFMSDLDANTYYPVTIPIPVARQTTLRIENALNSNAPSWSTHPSGFSCYIEWTTNGLGWGTIPISRRVTDWREQFATVQIVGGITQLGNGSTEVIWLRGGANYFFSADCDVTPTIRTTLYDLLGQTVEPRSSPFNNPRETATGRVALGSLQTNETSLFRASLLTPDNTNIGLQNSAGDANLWVDDVYGNFYMKNTIGGFYGDFNSYNFRSAASGEWAYMDGNMFRHNSSLRAPIFYDSNNTAYYADFAGTTSLNAVSAGTITATNFQATNAFYVNGTSYYLNSTNGGWYSNARIQSETDMRAPIFYDSNNTGYYVDPSNNSFIYGLSINVGQEATGAANSSTAGLIMRGNYNSNTWAHKFHKFDNGNGVPLYLSRTFGEGVWTGVQGWGTGLSYLSQVFGSFGADSVYSPIFYDSDNTAYYFDGTGGTRQSKFLTINGNTGGNNGNELVVGNTAVTYSMTDTNLRPIIQAHGAYPVLSLNHTITANTLHGPTVQFTANGTGRQFVIGMNGTGTQLDIGNSAASDWNPHNGIGGYNGITGLRMDSSGNVYNFISTRSPIFYDTNDTGYYIDPTGTSLTNVMRADKYHSLYSGGQPSPRFDCSFYVLQSQHWYSHNGASTMYIGEGGDFVYIRGYTTADISSRAPIFYDNNNTGFYVDPTGFSQMSSANGMWMCGTGNPADTVNGSTWYGTGRNNIGSGQVQLAGYYGILLRTASASMVVEGDYAQINGSYRAPIYYDSTNTAYYWNFADGATSNIYTSIVGLAYFKSNRNTSSNSAPLQAFSDDGGGAIMSFHRGGYYATNMGLDSDNVFRIGGWSASNNLFQMDMSGNLTMAGNVTAYSDARLKKDVKTITGALDTVGKMRGVTYTRIDTDKAGVGVIAQEMLEVMPQVVHQGVGDDDTLSVAYGNLVGVLIEAIKELSLKVKTLEEKDN
jgi:hypothetical protein